ncbi:hypothetical protein B9479_006318 [Cryptococcus floricola]|uniref:NADH dehydrogenase [ubiquinone] 1 alpha subcomplex subunit 1 n=1 Tax=Cryptococcus floricola TaxID=2591691 RepID=A0A5D3AS74_9TREE|nr:hypothetical protein B9479_006318 [Cryptococcus floricola]
MPVPWEALIPCGLLVAMFGVTGNLFSAAKFLTNDGKAPRYNIDTWESMMMERDRRLTGSLRGQSVSTICVSERLLTSTFFLPILFPPPALVPTLCPAPIFAIPQTEPIAPKAFATNSIWETERIH